jgi:hypothetical protein
MNSTNPDLDNLGDLGNRGVRRDRGHVGGHDISGEHRFPSLCERLRRNIVQPPPADARRTADVKGFDHRGALVPSPRTPTDSRLRARRRSLLLPPLPGTSTSE